MDPTLHRYAEMSVRDMQGDDLEHDEDELEFGKSSFAPAAWQPSQHVSLVPQP